MKKMLLLLLTMFLLGRMPIEIWNQGTPEQQNAFGSYLANQVVPMLGCGKWHLYAVEEGKEVFFILDCEEGQDEETKTKPPTDT